MAPVRRRRASEEDRVMPSIPSRSRRAIGGLLAGVLLAGAAIADVAVSPAGRDAGSPDLAVAADGTLYALWIDRGAAAPPAPSAPAPGHAAHGGAPRNHNSSVDVMLASSRDGGRTFGEPTRVNSTPGQVWSFPTSRPELVVAPNGTVHVLFTGNDVNAAGKPVIVPMYTRSTDRGRMFEPARKLAIVPETDLGHLIHGGFSQAETFGTLAVDRRGGVHVYWLDTRFMKEATDTAAIVSVHSTDDGKTFGDERVLLKTGLCPCCQLSASPGDGDALFLGLRHVEDGNRDSHVMRSDDGGLTFGTPVRLGGDLRWKIDGCPLKPTVVAAQGSRVYAAAFNGASEKTGVRFAVSSDGGRTFGAFQPVHADAAVSDAPSVVALPGDTVRVFWHGKAGDDPARAVFGTVSRDGGKTFAPVERLVGGAGIGYPVAVALPSGETALAYVGDGRIRLRTLAAGVATNDARATAVRSITVDEFRRALEAERGRVVVLNLWASWCAPCLKEIPALLRLERDYARCDVRVVGLATDDPIEVPRAVAATRARYFPTFTTYGRAEGEPDSYASVVDPAWNELMPTTYVLDRNGRVAERLQGGRSFEELARAVEKSAACG
jgi:thiol-disulfide isomerase/thioredoxin